jgi:hypothetical protein
MYTGRFESSVDHRNNHLADSFLTATLKKGHYLIAIEVFWVQSFFRNINLSATTSSNTKTDLKLISSGSNFDILFYKTFLSYYLDTYEAVKSKNEALMSKILKSKQMVLSTKLDSALSARKQEKKGDLKVELSYLELMEGFFVIFGTLKSTSNSAKIKLKIDPIFLQPNFIISPELIQLLNGSIGDLEMLELTPESPIFFYLVRVNLNGQYAHLPISNSFDRFLSGFEIVDLANPSTAKIDLLEDLIHELYFENIVFENILNTVIPNTRSTDKEKLQNLAELRVKDIDSRLGKDNKQLNLIKYQYGLNDTMAFDLEKRDSEDSVSVLEMDHETLAALAVRYGKLSTRVWNGSPVAVREYILQSEYFVAFYFENREPGCMFVEKRDFVLTNLKLSEVEAGNKSGSEPTDVEELSIELEIGYGKDRLVLLNPVETKASHDYSYTTKYKLVYSK